jgi:hypothetical protein
MTVTSLAAHNFAHFFFSREKVSKVSLIEEATFPNQLDE